MSCDATCVQNFRTLHDLALASRGMGADWSFGGARRRFEEVVVSSEGDVGARCRPRSASEEKRAPSCRIRGNDVDQDYVKPAVAGEAAVPSSFLQGVGGAGARERRRRGGGKTSAAGDKKTEDKEGNEGKELNKKKKKKIQTRWRESAAIIWAVWEDERCLCLCVV